MVISKKCSKKQIYIKSYKRSDGTKVKGHCSRPKGRKSRSYRISKYKKSIKNSIEKVKSSEQDSTCSNLSYSECDTALDSNNFRRCRINMKTKHCEDLPVEYRERATYQVGGSATYIPYKSSDRKQLQPDRLRPFKKEEELRHINMLIDENDRNIQKGQRLMKDLDELLKK